MKKLYFLVFCQLLIANGFAQSFNWSWGRYAVANNPGFVIGCGAACYTGQGVYVAGYYSGPAGLGNVTLGRNGASQYNFCLLHYDTAGNAKWAQYPTPHDSLMSCNANSVCTDNRGNPCITGLFYGDSLYFNNTKLRTTSSNGAAFTARYDTAGNVLWAAEADGACGNGIASDNNNNVYITGIISGSSMTIGDTTIMNTGIFSFFLAKYDGSGNLLWAQGSAGDFYDAGQAVATDAAGNVYVAGSYSSDSFKIGDTTLFNPGRLWESVPFTAKFDPSGRLVWIATPQGYARAYTYGITCDNTGNVYITGYFTDSITFGSTTLIGLIARGYTFYLVKYNSLGHAIWAKSGADAQSIGYCVTTDIDNNLYVSGKFGQQFGGYDETFICDSVTFMQHDGDPMFAMKLKPDGTVMNAQSWSSGGWHPNWMCIDHQGNGYLGGEVTDDTLYIAGDELPATGQTNFFIAKFKSGLNVCNLAPPQITATADTICASDSALICAPQGFALYQWNNGYTSNCFYTNEGGNYYVTVTDSNFCQATSNPLTLMVRTPGSISIAISNDTLRANSGYNWQWYLNSSPLTGDNLNEIIATQTGDYSVQITDSNGCSATSNPVTISGINQLMEDAISIYPNPSNGNWQLSSSNNLIGAAIEVCDATGKIVFKSAIKNQKSEIQIPGIAAGVYYLRVNTGDGVVVRKMVKM